MKVDYNIRKALREFMEERELKLKDLAEKIGVSSVAVSKWFNKDNSGIADSLWQTKILPLIQDKLPQERFFTERDGTSHYRSEVTKSPASVAEITRPVSVPLFLEDQLSLYDGKESLIDYAQRNGYGRQIDFLQRYAKAENSFAYSMQGGALPDIPTRATIFASAGKQPISGRLHIFKRTDGIVPQVGIYNFDQKAFQIDIWGVTWGDKTLAGKTSDFKRMVAWIHPVVYYIIDCK